MAMFTQMNTVWPTKKIKTKRNFVMLSLNVIFMHVINVKCFFLLVRHAKIPEASIIHSVVAADESKFCCLYIRFKIQYP